MNKRLMVLLLAAIMLLAVGCGNHADVEETTEPSQQLETEASPEVPDETIPGVEILDEPLANPFDEMEDAEQETTGNDGSTGNTGSSNSGDNGQSNKGNGNADSNTGNSGSNGSGDNQETSGNNTGNTGDTGSFGGENTEKPTDPEPTETQPTAPQPTEPGTTEHESTEPSSEVKHVSYEAYNNMTPAEQLAYYEQFPSMEAFVNWYNEAKAKYDEEHGAIDVGDGNIDLGDIVKP